MLVIEPGMAFGTGQHATTRGCLEAIEAAVVAGHVGSALDVGTGSGILALALARLGVPRVVALDVDPAVLPLARENLARNGAPQVLLFAGTAAAVRGRFDLVVANLLADTLIDEAPALAAAVGGGRPARALGSPRHAGRPRARGVSRLAYRRTPRPRFLGHTDARARRLTGAVANAAALIFQDCPAPTQAYASTRGPARKAWAAGGRRAPCTKNVSHPG